MRERGKLFHAIVSLGLAAVGCGGEVSTQGTEDTGTREMEEASSTADGGADTKESADAETSDFDASAESHETGTAGVDASEEIDAAMARDAAADVAEEFWPPPPIK